MTASAMTEKYKHRAPSPVWTLLEGRWVFELASFYSMRPLLKQLPKGDRHPVIVFPGFMASGLSTRPMRKLLKDLGYSAYDWGLGRNLRFNEEIEEKMHDLLKKTFLKHGCKVSLVGWSLGGVFAREIAKAYPDYVRSVVTLGSPITGPRHAARARPLFELINGSPTPETQERLKTCTSHRRFLVHLFIPRQMALSIGMGLSKTISLRRRTFRFRRAISEWAQTRLSCIF